jgi:hypothetical protein
MLFTEEEKKETKRLFTKQFIFFFRKNFFSWSMLQIDMYSHDLFLAVLSSLLCPEFLFVLLGRICKRKNKIVLFKN